MNETVREWIDKAEADYGTAEREFAAIKSPNHDAVCYHAQQCIEKLMKGLLIDRGVTPPRTHNLIWLGELLKPVYPEWSALEQDIDFLARAGVTFRYPGATAARDDAIEAMAICERLREGLLKVING